MELRECFNKHECDKGSKHGYERCYEPDFEKLKNKEINILEIGVDAGLSLGAWYDYFPKAKIYGIDLFQRSKMEDIKYFEKDRIEGLKADSTKPLTKFEVMNRWPDIKFDIIIDDGMHAPEHNLKTFKNFFPLLNEGGHYYIEDVWPLDKMNPKQLQNWWIRSHPERFSFPLHESLLKEIEKYNVDRYDFRSTAHPDSYIIRIKK